MTTNTDGDAWREAPLLLWLSPAFPVGAFAYSHGLEWAYEAGDVTDAASLAAWLADLARFGAPHLDAALFAHAFRAAAAADWPALDAVNELAVALAGSAERRLETTAQGAAFRVAARAAWDCEALARLSARDGEPLAYPVAVAAAAAGCGMALEPRGGSVRRRPVRQSRLRRDAAWNRRPDRRAEDPGRDLAGAFRAGARGGGRVARRSRRLRVALRHRRDAARNAIFEAVPLMTQTHSPLRVGVGGPVGSGKTALMEQLCKRLSGAYEIAAITNDIYTKEDARILVEAGALPPERIMGVETGGCPHTAIREDASINLAAIDDMRRRFPALDLILVESGGDNLAATFSPELADLTIYVIDVAGGEKVPRKGGPGVTRSDLLVINKIDLAPYVGASLEVMARDAALMRKTRPFVMANMKTGEGVDAVIAFIRDKGGL